MWASRGRQTAACQSKLILLDIDANLGRPSIEQPNSMTTSKFTVYAYDRPKIGMVLKPICHPESTPWYLPQLPIRTYLLIPRMSTLTSSSCVGFGSSINKHLNNNNIGRSCIELLNPMTISIFVVYAYHHLKEDNDVEANYPSKINAQNLTQLVHLVLRMSTTLTSSSCVGFGSSLPLTLWTIIRMVFQVP